MNTNRFVGFKLITSRVLVIQWNYPDFLRILSKPFLSIFKVEASKSNTALFGKVLQYFLLMCLCFLKAYARTYIWKNLHVQINLFQSGGMWQSTQLKNMADPSEKYKFKTFPHQIPALELLKVTLFESVFSQR